MGWNGEDLDATVSGVATKTVVLFGGDIGAAGLEFNDTWTWDGTTWTRQFRNSAPAARADASMAYDATLGMVVLFGGYAGSWPDILDDTWRWDGINWKQMNPATVPPNRYALEWITTRSPRAS